MWHHCIMLQHPGIQLMQNRTLAWWPHRIRTVPFQDSCWWSSRPFPPEVSCYSVWNRATWYNVIVSERVTRYSVIVCEMVMQYNVIVCEMVTQYNVIVCEMVTQYSVIVRKMVTQYNVTVYEMVMWYNVTVWNSHSYNAIVCETMR